MLVEEAAVLCSGYFESDNIISASNAIDIHFSTPKDSSSELGKGARPGNWQDMRRSSGQKIHLISSSNVVA